MFTLIVQQERLQMVRSNQVDSTVSDSGAIADTPPRSSKRHYSTQSAQPERPFWRMHATDFWAYAQGMGQILDARNLHPGQIPDARNLHPGYWETL